MLIRPAMYVSVNCCFEPMTKSRETHITPQLKGPIQRIRGLQKRRCGHPPAKAGSRHDNRTA